MSTVAGALALRAEADLPRARLDRDYRARDCVTEPEFAKIISSYRSLSDQATTRLPSRTTIVYDPRSGERLDIYGADGRGAPRPAVLCIHGGYWRALSRADTAFMAPALAANGIATVVPDYTLAPAASMTEIVRQVRAALAFIWHNHREFGLDRARILVTGSSAGGHLAACLLSPGWQSGMGLPPQPVHAALPISGLFELAPIAASHVQEWIRLTPAEVEDFSPIRSMPQPVPKTVVAVAENETAGFHRQSAGYAAALGARLETVPGRNHFDVFLDLMEPESRLFRSLIELLK